MMFMPLISLITGKAKWVIIIGVLAVVAWGYWTYSRNEIAALHQQVAVIQKQADDLQAANVHIQADVEAIRQAEEQAARSIQDVRTRSAQAATVVRSQHLAVAAKANPKAVEQQINQATADAFKGFEDATRAP